MIKLMGLEMKISKNVVNIFVIALLIMTGLFIIEFMSITIPSNLFLLHSLISLVTNIAFTITGVIVMIVINKAYFKNIKDNKATK